MKLSPWEPDLRTVVGRIDTGDIDLQPDFQRQEIWLTAKKKRLIDTVLRGWSIPPIFLVVLADGRMEVLDGQQRLAALRDFMHDEFAIDGGITPLDQAVSVLDGLFYGKLPSAQKRHFDQYTLRCLKLTDYNPDEPSELFYRLNQPSMLTAGEQRNAFYGPARQQLKSLVLEFEGCGNGKREIGFSNARLAYDDILARLLFFLEVHSFGVKGTENLISQRFKAKSEFPPIVFDRARRAVKRFSTSREMVGTVRLNKASTLSWLLFFARFDDDETPEPAFMRYFSDERSVTSYEGYQCRLLFQDRSSLRVTDVSSVVYRDFALWASYVYELDCKPPRRLPVAQLAEIYGRLGPNSDQQLTNLLAHELDLKAWSDLG